MVTYGGTREPKYMTSKKGVEYSRTPKEAILFLAQLKSNEESLVEQVKLLEKTEKYHLKAVFSTNVDGWTPFHAFVLRGARKLVKIALRCGVDANLQMGQPESLPGGCCPLHLAAYRGDVSIIQLLLQHNADVNKKDYSDKSPIYYAATHQNTLAVKKLLKVGADISDVDADQRHLYRKGYIKRNTSILCLRSTLL